MMEELIEKSFTVAEFAVKKLAETLPVPVRVPTSNGGFTWKHQDESIQVALVCKSVRIVTSLKGAYILALNGMTAESNSLLRLCSDYHIEIMFLCKGITDGVSETHKAFLDRFFFDYSIGNQTKKKPRFTSRKEHFDTVSELLRNSGVTEDEISSMQTMANGITNTLDSYVHAHYTSTMDLFTGIGNTFMLGPNESPIQMNSTFQFINAKTWEMLMTIESACTAMDLQAVSDYVYKFRFSHYG